MVDIYIFLIFILGAIIGRYLGILAYKIDINVSLNRFIVEILTGVSFVVLYVNFGLSIRALTYMFFITMLILVSIIDLKTQYVYEILSVIGIISGLIFTIYKHFQGKDIFYYISGGIVLALIMLILAYLGTMGWGDIEVAFMCGLYLGLEAALIMIFIAIIIGGIVSSILFISKIKFENISSSIAFIPYMAIGSFISLIWEEEFEKVILIYYGLY